MVGSTSILLIRASFLSIWPASTQNVFSLRLTCVTFLSSSPQSDSWKLGVICVTSTVSAGSTEAVCSFTCSCYC